MGAPGVRRGRGPIIKNVYLKIRPLSARGKSAESDLITRLCKRG